MDKIINDRYRMISGQGEAQDRRYHKYPGSRPGSLWLVADQPNAGDNIYWYPNDPKSQGFGGATLTFITVEGEELHLKGCWHSNSDSLFKDTGVDCRHLYRGWFIIAKDGEYTEGGVLMKDILFDQPPHIGTYEGYNVAAKWISRLLQIPVFVHHQSHGGSSTGPTTVWGRESLYWERK